MKLFSNEPIDILKLGGTDTLPNEQGGGGAKLDGLLFSWIERVKPFIQSLACPTSINGILILTGIIEDEEYTALTGQEGKYGFYIAESMTVSLGPIGAPSLGKIMVDMGLTLDDLKIVPMLHSSWNSVTPKNKARIALSVQLSRYASIFEATGNPFDKMRDSENVNTESEAV
jgi:hypothetical protein